MGVYEERKQKIQKYASKALQLNRQTQSVIDLFKIQSIKVDNTKQLQQVKERIENILSKEKPTQRDLDLVKEYSSETTYDYIKVTLPISTDTNTDINIVEENEFNYKDVRLALYRQLRTPDKLTNLDIDLIRNFSHFIANQKIDYTDIPQVDIDDTMSDEDIDKLVKQKIKEFKNKSNINHDVSIGGNSEIINKLSYTYDCEWIGRKFVERLQQAMSDEKIFIILESWFRSAKAENVRDQIEAATGNDWYDLFLDFSTTILSALNNIKTLSNKISAIFNDDDFKDALETAASQVLGKEL